MSPRRLLLASLAAALLGAAPPGALAQVQPRDEDFARSVREWTTRRSS